MINVKEGNILNCNEDIIVHQVNVQGIMGGGLARQLANKYKDKQHSGFELETYYNIFCKKYDCKYKKLKGKVNYYTDEIEPKIIANMFSQMENFDTDYEAMRESLTKIKGFAEEANLSIAIPYGIGCGIAHGDWNKVFEIIEEIFGNYDVTLYRLEANE